MLTNHSGRCLATVADIVVQRAETLDGAALHKCERGEPRAEHTAHGTGGPTHGWVRFNSPARVFALKTNYRLSFSWFSFGSFVQILLTPLYSCAIVVQAAVRPPGKATTVKDLNITRVTTTETNKSLWLVRKCLLKLTDLALAGATSGGGGWWVVVLCSKVRHTQASV